MEFPILTSRLTVTRRWCHRPEVSKLCPWTNRSRCGEAWKRYNIIVTWNRQLGCIYDSIRLLKKFGTTEHSGVFARPFAVAVHWTPPSGTRHSVPPPAGCRTQAPQMLAPSSSVVRSLYWLSKRRVICYLMPLICFRWYMANECHWRIKMHLFIFIQVRVSSAKFHASRLYQTGSCRLPSSPGVDCWRSSAIKN